MALEPQGHLVVGAARLEYRLWGPDPGDAPTIVLLHEGLGCVALWRDFPERLAAATGLGVLAYSREGYGGSSGCALPRPLDYMQQEAEKSLPLVLERIGFRSGLLIGHSDGASIAAVYAGRARDRRVRGVVLMAPHFFTEPDGLASIAAVRAAYGTTDLRDRLARYHGNNVDCAFLGWSGAWLDPGFEAWNIEDCLDTLTSPVLAIQGRDDEYGSVRQVETVRARCIGGVEALLLDACGHSPQRDQPEATLAAVASFAARIFA